MSRSSSISPILAREWSRYVAALAALDDDGWDRPTGLRGWSVRDLVAHTIWGVSMEADALRRWHTGDAAPAAGQVMDPAGDGERLLAAQRAAVDALLGETSRLDHGDSQRNVPMPYGPLPVDLVLQIFAMEAGVHTYDLLSALGEPAELAADVVVATAAVLAAFLPVLGAASDSPPANGAVVRLRSPSVDLQLRRAGGNVVARVEPTGAGANEITCDDSSLVLFALGRLPADAVDGPDEVRTQLKRWFPGP